jgi:hypothetical protein
VANKSLRVEVLFAAASPTPPPATALFPDPVRLGPAWPDDLPWLLALLPHADLYLQDAVQVALHPTLIRGWCRRGRRGQRTVQAPGTNQTRDGFGLVDGRSGWFDWALADGRKAEPFGAQLRRAVTRSRARGRIAIVILDNLSIHTPTGSQRLRLLLDEVRDALILVSTPPYDPDSNRIAWLWRALRKTVTHTHQRATLADLLADADAWAQALTATQILRQIGSPFAGAPLTDDDTDTPIDQELAHAA